MPLRLVAESPLALTGQRGRGIHGQYVYWIVMAFPTPETMAKRGVRTPDDFTHDSFTALVVQVLGSCDAPLEETICFREPHANGKPRFNLLVRASSHHYHFLPTSTRKKYPGHTKNHHFRAGACSGAC